MNNGKKSGSRKFPLLIVISIGVFISFMLSFFLGDSGILRLRQLNEDYERGRLENYGMSNENRELMLEIKRLKEDPSTVEKIAREELHMVSPQDTVLIVPREKEEDRR